MPTRDLAAEVAHLVAWWATRPSLSPQAVSKEAGRHRNALARILSGERLPTARMLDDFYPMLGKYGYAPMSNEYLFL